MERRHGAYVISDDPARLDTVAIHAYLSRSYWSPDIPLGTVRLALKNSLSVGAYLVSDASSSAKPTDDKQVGLVRIITDFATYAYLCDVYVLESHRKHGLARAMMAMTMELPNLQGLRSWNLRTRDAHPLYAQFSFKVIENPGGYMIHRPTGVPPPEAG